LSGNLQVELALSFEASAGTDVSGSFQLSQLKDIPAVADFMSKYGVSINDRGKIQISTQIPSTSAKIGGIEVGVEDHVKATLEGLHIHLSGSKLTVEVGLGFDVSGSLSASGSEIDLQPILDQIRSQLPAGVNVYLDSNNNLVLEASSPDVAKQLWGFNVGIRSPSVKIVFEKIRTMLENVNEPIKISKDQLSANFAGFNISVRDLQASVLPAAGVSIEGGKASLAFSANMSVAGVLSASGTLDIKTLIEGATLPMPSNLEQLRGLIDLDSLVRELQGKVSAPSLPDPTKLVGQLDLKNLVKSYKLEEKDGKLCITTDLNDLSTSLYGLTASVSGLRMLNWPWASGTSRYQTPSPSRAPPTSPSRARPPSRAPPACPRQGLSGTLTVDLSVSFSASAGADVSGSFPLSQLQSVPTVSELLSKYGVTVRNNRLYLTTSIPQTSTTLAGMNVTVAVQTVEVGLQNLHVHLSGSNLSLELSLDFNVAGGSLSASGQLDLQSVLDQIRSQLPAGVNVYLDSNNNLVLEASSPDVAKQLWGFNVTVRQPSAKLVIPKVYSKLSDVETISIGPVSKSLTLGGWTISVQDLSASVSPAAEVSVQSGTASLSFSTGLATSGRVSASGTLNILDLVNKNASLPVPSDLTSLAGMADLSNLVDQLKGKLSAVSVPTDPSQLVGQLNLKNLVKSYRLEEKDGKLCITTDLNDLSTSLYGLTASVSGLRVELALGEWDVQVSDSISVSGSADFAVSGSASLTGTADLSQAGLTGKLDVDLSVSFSASAGADVSGSFPLSQLQSVPTVSELLSKYGVTVRNNRLYLTTSIPQTSTTLAGMNVTVAVQTVEVGLQNLHVHLSGSNLSLELSLDFNVAGGSLSASGQLDLQSVLDQIRSQLPAGVNVYLDSNNNLVLEASSPDVAKQLWGFNVTVRQPSARVVIPKVYSKLSDVGDD